MAGRRPDLIRKSSSSRACSTMPCCGKPGFKTSPVLWEPISMHVSSGNCETVPEPSTWPLMPIPTAVANKRRIVSRNVSGNGASLFALYRCPTAMIPTASSCKAATTASSSRYWRQLIHELPGCPSTHPQSGAQRVSHCRNHGPRGRLGQSLSGLRMPPSHGRSYLAKLCAALAALSPLVGKCSSHRCDCARALTESTLLDYVRFQSAQQPPFSGTTINQRVAVADRALRATFPGAPRQIAPEFQVNYWRRAPMGLGRRMPAVSRLRVREPKRTIVPLSVEDVARFWSSFRTSRDLAIVGLMLLQGLRSQEVRDLNRDDLRLPEA